MAGFFGIAKAAGFANKKNGPAKPAKPAGIVAFLNSSNAAAPKPMSSFLQDLAGGALGLVNDIAAPDFFFGPGATVTGQGALVLSTIGQATSSAAGIVGGISTPSAAEKAIGSCLEANGICADPFKAAPMTAGLVGPLGPAPEPRDFNVVKSEVDASGFLLAAVVLGGIYLWTRKK